MHPYYYPRMETTETLMEVYLLRHGAAQPNAASGRDADRELTPDGIASLRATLIRARDLGVNPSLILTSPYVRARQTAEIAAEIFGCREPLVPAPSLTPDSSISALWDEVRTMADNGALLLITHEPLASAAANWMIRLPERLRFGPGTIARIDFVNVTVEPRGVLRWILP